MAMTTLAVAELPGRSNRPGSDREDTGYDGGNPSVEEIATGPVTGGDVELPRVRRW